MSGTWRLRGYTVERLLGRGASSDVWRARISGSGEPVALKRLTLTSDAQRRRARAEAAMLTVLDHPNLVRLHDVVLLGGGDGGDGTVVLVLDLAEGGSLADVLAARGRLTPGEVITAVAPVAAALAYVHRHGVVHGDVTPANILFTPGGVALLADLGVARLTGDDADAESTPAYVDPAVAAGSVPGTSSDVFMLGAVALHALTGAPAWRDLDEALVAASELEPRGVAERLAAAGVDDAMAAVLLRALQPDPHRRCTAADLALDLRHSGTPIAVELAAGRERPDPGSPPDVATSPPPDLGHGRTSPRPTSRDRTAVAARARTAGARTAGARTARPGYDARHAAPLVPPGPPPGPPALPPTSAVRRPRPDVPRRAPRRLARRRVLLGGAAGLATVVAALAVLGAVGLADASTGRSAGAGTAVPEHTPGGPPASTPTPAVTPGTPATPVTRADWVTALRALDAVRARAFATRSPALLRRVYLPGPLLRADTALLGRVVPPGCGLSGAMTRYEAVRVTPRTGGATVTARAGIPAAVLHCDGRPERRTAPVGPSTVRLLMTATPAGPRIARQQVG